MTLARDSRGPVLVAGVGVLFTLVAPSVLELFTIINLTTAIALAVLALSLALVWGYGGILCFGQTAFFGLGAYAYTIAAHSTSEARAGRLLSRSLGRRVALCRGARPGDCSTGMSADRADLPRFTLLTVYAHLYSLNPGENLGSRPIRHRVKVPARRFNGITRHR